MPLSVSDGATASFYEWMREQQRRTGLVFDADQIALMQGAYYAGGMHEQDRQIKVYRNARENIIETERSEWVRL